MKILVTNDDGYYAQGLHTLVNILRPVGDITVVAPKYHQSGMSMAVTMGFKPIAVKELDAREYGAVKDSERWFYLDGTPASCVKFGIDNVMPDDKPDIIISGINHGCNAAMATLYSGTIGAAMEAAVNGIPAIGVSLDDLRPECDFSAVERFLPELLSTLMSHISDRYGEFYNINFPKCPADKIKGIRTAHLGFIHWEDEYQDYDPDAAAKHGYDKQKMGLIFTPPVEPGEELYMMAGHICEDEINDDLSDHRLIERGYITVSSQNIDNTDYAENRRLRSIGLDKDFLK